MIKRKLTEADWFLIVANLLPVYGVWFDDWNAKEIFLVYCLETIIIGFYTLVKLGIASTVRNNDWWENNGSKTSISGLFLMLFFLLHYALFVAVQSYIFLGVVSLHGEQPTDILQLLVHLNQYLGKESWLVLSGFLFAYGYESLMQFIWNNEFRIKSMSRIMFEPYLRIFVQQSTVIIGLFFLVLGAEPLFILLFAGVRIFLTVFIQYEFVLDSLSKRTRFQESKSSHS